MQITVDTSVVMAVLLREPARDDLIERTRDAELLAAPTLPWEVGNALSALLRRDRLQWAHASAALAGLTAIPLRLPEIELDDAVALANRFGIYAYDAYVIACARRYHTPLLSLDQAQNAVAREAGVTLLEV